MSHNKANGVSNPEPTTPPHLPLTTEIHRFFALQATKLMPLLNHRQARMGPWNLAARCLFWDTSKLEVLVVLGKHATKWPFFYKNLFALEKRKLETHTLKIFGNPWRHQRCTNQFLAGCRCGNDFKMFCRILDRYCFDGRKNTLLFDP